MDLLLFLLLDRVVLLVQVVPVVLYLLQEPDHHPHLVVPIIILS